MSEIRIKYQLIYPIALLLTIVAVVAGIFIGTIMISPLQIIQIIGSHTFGLDWYHGSENTAMIVWEIRMPRVILAFLVGATLSLAGAAFQGLLRNPLVDPYTIGVSSGASLGAVLVLFLQIQLPLLGQFTLPLVAIITSMLTLLIVFSFTKTASNRLANETIILTGIIINSFIGAIVTCLIALAQTDHFRQILFWLMGSVSMRNWGHVHLLFPFFLFGAVVILYHQRVLNALALGEEAAQYIGVHVRRKRLLILAVAAVITGAAVSVSGAIGFVGLVIPHLVRLLVGSNHRHVLPLSIIVGGTFLVLADMVARSIIAPQELPIGVVTAMVGAPIFAVLLIKERKQRDKF